MSQAIGGAPGAYGTQPDGAPRAYWTESGPVQGPLAQQETAGVAERGMARIADPVPLGLAGFAAATFTVSTILAGWFDARDLVITIPLLFVFGGVTQFVAGLWSFARSNVLASVAFCSFGAFYASLALLLWMQAAHLVNPLTARGSDQSKVAGVFILMFALIAAYLCLAAIGENRVIAAVLGMLTLAYLADGTGLWIGGINIVLEIGGYAGLVSALLAFYLSGAIVVNSVRKREVLPVFAAAIA